MIERTETGFETHENEASVANDWVRRHPKWEARVSADYFLTSSPEVATARCRARRDALGRCSGLLSRPDFDWVKPPVLNPYTRLAVTMSPAHGALRVAGYEMTGGELPEQVTQLLAIEDCAG